MAEHDLIFFANRNTPKVIAKGKAFDAPDGYGKVVKRRAATADEEKKIASGEWLRVDKQGNKPGDGKYKGGSNYRPQLRDKSSDIDPVDDNAGDIVDGNGDTVPAGYGVVPHTNSTGSIFARIGPSTPEWHKIIRINNDGSSEVVQDYKLVQVVETALAELADADDTPQEQQLLMTAWQAIAMYLSTCDDEDKASALNALKVISNLMSNADEGPTPTGTFGTTMQTAASSTFTCPTCSGREFSTQQGLINHLKNIHNRKPKEAS